MRPLIGGASLPAMSSDTAQSAVRLSRCPISTISMMEDTRLTARPATGRGRKPTIASSKPRMKVWRRYAYHKPSFVRGIVKSSRKHCASAEEKPVFHLVTASIRLKSSRCTAMEFRWWTSPENAEQRSTPCASMHPSQASIVAVTTVRKCAATAGCIHASKVLRISAPTSLLLVEVGN